MSDDDDDMLLELLSYTCPVTGKKRTAGSLDNEVTPAKCLDWTASYQQPKPCAKYSEVVSFHLQP